MSLGLDERAEMMDSPIAGPRLWPAALLLFLATSALYLLTMPTVFPSLGDALDEISWVQQPFPYFRPNHLLLSPLYNIILGIASGLGLAAEPMLVLETVNALAGGGCAALFFIFLRRMGCRYSISLTAAALIAVCFGMWLHSREVETGIITQLFLLLSLAAMPPGGRNGRFASPWTGPALAGLAAALCVCMSLNCVVLLPAWACVLVLARLRNRPLLSLVVFAVVCGAVGLFFYVLAYFHESGGLDIPGMLVWLTHHPSQSQLGGRTGSISLQNLMRAASGLLNCMVGYTPLTTNLKQILTGGQSLTVDLGDWLRFLLGVLVWVVFAVYLIRALFIRGKSGATLALLICLVPLIAFNTLWLGSDPQFWLPGLPFLLLPVFWGASGGMGRGRARPASLGLLALIMIGLAVANFGHPTPTVLQPEGGPEWQRAKAFEQELEPNDLVIWVRGWPRYLQVLGKSRDLNLIYPPWRDDEKAVFADKLLEAVDQARTAGGKVYGVHFNQLSDPRVAGGWDEVAQSQGMDRQQILDMLGRNHELVPLTDPALGGEVSRIE